MYRDLGFIEDHLIEDTNNVDTDDPSLGTFTSFSQKEFYPTISDERWLTDNDLKGRETGWVFVPTACQNKTADDTDKCRIHFALHGCNGNPKGMARGGYNALGALNDIIMVYPDTRCWDNEGGGIDPEFFNTNHGIVPTAFRMMIEKITGI